MKDSECYEIIKRVDLTPVLPVLDRLSFMNSNSVCAWVTKPGSVMPIELLMLLQSLKLGGSPHRLFCRKLEAHQGIAPHVDAHEWLGANHIRRFQLPLVSHPDIVMRWPDDGISLHLEPGWLYEVRYDRLHEVINNTNHERIHVQIDQSYGN